MNYLTFKLIYTAFKLFLFMSYFNMGYILPSLPNARPCAFWIYTVITVGVFGKLGSSRESVNTSLKVWNKDWTIVINGFPSSG